MSTPLVESIFEYTRDISFSAFNVNSTYGKNRSDAGQVVK